MTDDFEKLDLNTNVSALMELSNALGEFAAEPAAASSAEAFAAREAIEALVIMLAPFSPHVAEEMWEGLGHAGALLKSAKWPSADAELARKDELEIPVQVNGKLRSKVIVAPDISKDELVALALNDEKVSSFIDRNDYDKDIVVPQRLVNVVVKRWDKRLDEHGFDAIIWASGEHPVTAKRKITFIFKEKGNDDRDKIEEYLIPNEAGNQYSATGQVSQKLEARGIQDVVVTLETEQNRSMIDIRMKGDPELIRVIKPYR